MGCGQSKINLYPRRNKNGGKGNSAKKSGAAEKEADEEEGSAGSGGAGGAACVAADAEDDTERVKQILPLAVHPPPIEISASQQDFFKMLDEKIEQGRDYDSSSETEVHIEKERRRVLIEQWRSASQSIQSSLSRGSPPTPLRRRACRPPPPERQHSPASRAPHRAPHPADTASPPSRRSHSSHSQHPTDHRSGEWLRDEHKSPVKRPQSAGPNWKNNPKVAPYNQKQKKHEEQKTLEHNQDKSQITYNPTFQSHSPAHSAAVKPNQPYIAQLITYPVSQQVTPPSPPKYIAPPEEYQDPQNHVPETKYPAPPQQVSPTPSNQSGIYYIGTSPTAQDLAQQRQQTALHLQQYVAMKQAQQQMFTYLQRSPHTVFPSMDFSQMDATKVYEEQFAHYTQQTTLRPHSAPAPAGVKTGALPPGYEMPPVPAQIPQVSAMWPAVMPVVGPWVPGQVAPEMFYPGQYYRAGSAGSAGTLTRYHKREDKNVCQSINIVRQKPVGQIVVGGTELSVSAGGSDSTSPASVSTDSGVSPGAAPTLAPAPTPPPAKPLPPQRKDIIPNHLDTKTKKKTPHFTRTLKNSKSLDSS